MRRRAEGKGRLLYGAILGLSVFLFPLARAENVKDVLMHDDEAEQVLPSGKAVQEEDLSPEESDANSVREGYEHPPSSVEEEMDSPDEQRTQFPSTTAEPTPSMEPSAPAEIPPFMSRPSEWETAPPTVIGLPPLPTVASFSGRDLAAFQFVETGKENFDQEHWEQAEEQFEHAISLAPFLPYSYYFLGRIAFARGDHKRALAFLQKAELLFPHTERAWLGETDNMKGLVYEDLNDYKQARIAYQKSLRFQPANLKVLSALARLPEEEPPPSNALVQ